MNELDITGIDKAELLAALYNNARPVRLGWIHFQGGEMTKEEAAKLLGEQTYFDYVGGRPLKVNLKGNTLSPALYDRDQGQGKCERIVESLRKARK